MTSEPNDSPAPAPATVHRPIADRALRLTGAELTLVAVTANHDIPPSEVATLMIVEAAGAAMPSRSADAIPIAGTSIGQAFVERTPRRLNNLDITTAGVHHSGPALVLPLRTTDTVTGVLIALRRGGARTFSEDQLDMMAAFTDQAALAWQLGSTPRRLRELDILAERDRIARHLNHHVIRQIFAIELALHATIPRARSTEVQQRLSRNIDALDDVIQEIRVAIFDAHGAMHGPLPDTTRLRERLDDVLMQSCGSDLETTVQFVGSLSIVGAALADHTENVVREAVSNAVRHAGATRVAVTVKVEDNICIEVIDNGQNIPGDGLRSLHHHTQQAGGTLTIADAPGGGTSLRWSAPLP